MQLLDESLKRTNEFDSYGIWNVAGYFISDDMSAAEIAASNYRSLMNGENSGREVSAINSWRQNDLSIPGNYEDLTTYLSRFAHPKFIYGHDGLRQCLHGCIHCHQRKRAGTSSWPATCNNLRSSCNPAC